MEKKRRRKGINNEYCFVFLFYVYSNYSVSCIFVAKKCNVGIKRKRCKKFFFMFHFILPCISLIVSNKSIPNLI